MKLSREFYIPKNAIKVKSKKSSAVVYLSDKIKPCAIGFRGKADKPAFNYSFKNAEARAKWVADWIVQQDQAEAYVAERKAEKSAKLAKPQDALKVGDVLKSVWGYDQTNVDYYEVIELVGKRAIIIREIGCESIDTLFMQGRSVPLKGKYIGEPMKKIVNESGSVKIASYAYASKMEPMKDKNGISLGYQSSSWSNYA